MNRNVFALLLLSLAVLAGGCTSTESTTTSASIQTPVPPIGPTTPEPVAVSIPPPVRIGTPAAVPARGPALAADSPFQGHNLGQMTIRDRAFTIEYSALIGRLKAGHLDWEVTMDGDSRHYAGQVWRPRAFSEDILPVGDAKLTRWSDVITNPPRPAALKGSSNLYSLYGTLTVFGTHRIYDARLAFSDLNGTEFKVKWTGKCDVFADRGYETAVPFAIDTRMNFEGILCKVKDEAKARELLANHLDPDEFVAEKLYTGYIFFRPRKAASN